MNARSLGRFLWTSFSFASMATTVLLAMFLLVIPKTVDALPLTILTGSMRPAMPPGTLAVVQPTDPARLRVGDVATYQWEPGNPALVTHRIIEIRHSSNGGTTLILKGDNNAKSDPPAQAEQVMGKVIYAVPYFGWVTHSINSDTGRKYIKWVAYAFIAYSAWSFLTGILAALRPRNVNRSFRATNKRHQDRVQVQPVAPNYPAARHKRRARSPRPTHSPGISQASIGA